jgi:hypothetical protein
MIGIGVKFSPHNAESTIKHDISIQSVTISIISAQLLSIMSEKISVLG